MVWRDVQMRAHGLIGPDASLGVNGSGLKHQVSWGSLAG